jgi:hypothetical protein
MMVNQAISLLKCNLIFSWNETDRKACRKSRSVIAFEIYEMEIEFELSSDQLGYLKPILISLIS